MPISTDVHLCGVNVTNVPCVEIIEKIHTFLHGMHTRQIVTINPEFLCRSVHDAAFRDILNKADLHVIDGFGVTCAFAWHGKKVHCRMTGVELMWHLLDCADRDNLSVFLATNAFGLTLWHDMRAAIIKRYPNMHITGANMDPRKPQIDTEYEADIILCNFGAPHQEKLIYQFKKKNIGKIGIGVGGAFDFATGAIKRAPHWMRKCGCEWLWRLVRQPHRWRRIVRAVIIFPIYVLRGK